MLCASKNHFPPVGSNLLQQGTTGNCILKRPDGRKQKVCNWFKGRGRIFHNADIHVTQEEVCLLSWVCKGVISNIQHMIEHRVRVLAT